jgi:integrase
MRICYGEDSQVVIRADETPGALQRLRWALERTIPYGSNPETCPVRTVQAWLEQAGIITGPLFRSINRHGQVQAGRLSGIDVARVVKKLADRAGLDVAKCAGHSLRAEHATSAAIAGASERSIMNQTGHRSVQMVRRYIRDGSLFRENSAGKLGL